MNEIFLRTTISFVAFIRALVDAVTALRLIVTMSAPIAREEVRGAAVAASLVGAVQRAIPVAVAVLRLVVALRLVAPLPALPLPGDARACIS